MKIKLIPGVATPFVAVVMLSLALTQLSSCKKSDPAPSAQDVMKAKLTANLWKMQSVTVDGVDKSSVFTGLTIQFTSTAYTTTNGKAVWPASGTWTFVTTDGTTIKRDDGIEVKVEATDATLKLTLTWLQTTFGGGRAESIGGVNVFNMVK